MSGIVFARATGKRKYINEPTHAQTHDNLFVSSDCFTPCDMRMYYVCIPIYFLCYDEIDVGAHIIKPSINRPARQTLHRFIIDTHLLLNSLAFVRNRTSLFVD